MDEDTLEAQDCCPRCVSNETCPKCHMGHLIEINDTKSQCDVCGEFFYLKKETS